MRARKYSEIFIKKISKLKGNEMRNVQRKIIEVREIDDLKHFKNLKYDIKKYKRVHVNDSFVILFFDEQNVVNFVDYEHHDKVYKPGKKLLKKYKDLHFS